MKSVMIIIDGLGDEPLSELGGRTPLEAAFIPNMHYIANRGRVGSIKTTFPGFPIESMVCIMGLLGYEPEQYYPSGRAGFEAMAKGLPLSKNDLILRCNCVTADLQEQRLTDFTAGLITDSDARKVITQIELPDPHWELYPGQSYRNVLIIRNAGVNAKAIRCFEPHMHIGRSIHDILPQAGNGQTDRIAGALSSFLLDTQRQIANMNLPSTCRANMLWVWNPSHKPIWPSFKERTGLEAAFVGGLDFLHGIAMAAKIHYDIVPGATGYIDTNYEAKAEYALKYLKTYDFVLIHINAADEEAHQRNAQGKIEAIEKVDCFIVRPILYELEKRYRENYRIVICGDHTTRCSDGKHTDGLVPYALHGVAVKPSLVERFDERHCSDFSPVTSLDFLRKVVWKQKAL
jgi:2,3-bisphosphoglycerate-independent phosphoglycerate mutase